MTHGDDLNRKREAFYVDNLSRSNKTGLMLYDNTFTDITQVKEDRFVIDTDEMERVNKQVYSYMGTNEKILTNSYTEEEWGAWYEGSVEPFLLELGEGISKAELTPTQRKKNRFFFSTSYLQYATPESKRKVMNDGIDRGVMSVNEARDILQLPHIPGGDVRNIRGEYYLIDADNNVVAESGGHNSSDPPGTDWGDDTNDTDNGEVEDHAV